MAVRNFYRGRLRRRYTAELVTVRYSERRFRLGDLGLTATGRVAPTYGTPAETVWNTANTKSTTVGGTGSGSLTWAVGDHILVLAVTGDSTLTIATPTATGLDFVPQGSPVVVTNSCWAHKWLAVAQSAGSSVITAVPTPTTGDWGMIAWVVSGTDGIGNSAGGAATAQTISLATSQDHSAVFEVVGDWGAGSTSGHTWTPSGQTEREAQQVAGAYTVYVADWADRGTAGTTSYGVSVTASGSNYTKLAVEMLGVSIVSSSPTGAGDVTSHTTTTSTGAKATSGPGATTQHAATASTATKAVAAGTGTATRTAVTATGTKGAAAGTATAQHSSTQPTGSKQGAGVGAVAQHTADTTTIRKQAAGAGATVQHAADTTTGTKQAAGTGTAPAHPVSQATVGAPGPSGAGTATARTAVVATGTKQAAATGTVVQHTTDQTIIRKQAAGLGAAQPHPSATSTAGPTTRAGTTTLAPHPVTATTAGPRATSGQGRVTAHPTATAGGLHAATGTARVTQHPATASTGVNIPPYTAVLVGIDGSIDTIGVLDGSATAGGLDAGTAGTAGVLSGATTAGGLDAGTVGAIGLVD